MMGISLSQFLRQRLHKVVLGRRCRRYRVEDILALVDKRVVTPRGTSTGPIANQRNSQQEVRNAYALLD
jgi:hypothetical protein